MEMSRSSWRGSSLSRRTLKSATRATWSRTASASLQTSMARSRPLSRPPPRPRTRRDSSLNPSARSSTPSGRRSLTAMPRAAHRDSGSRCCSTRDDRVLKYVKDITAQTDSDGSCTVEMKLWENPFLKTETLSRCIRADGSTEGTTIEWKDDANGDSMQYKTVKRGKFGKAVSSILWGFDDEKGALSQEEIELL